MDTPLIPAEEVRRIAVLRALVLGDVLCALPALRALRAACPRAHITLIGLPWTQALVQRLQSVDDFIRFPGHPGMPESPADLGALPGFLAEVQTRRFDLALQLHGSGGISNPLLACFGARRSAGFFVPGAWRPEPPLFIPWPETGHEIERCLALTDALGCPRQGLQLEFPVHAGDAGRLQAVWPQRADAPYVVLHAGSQLRSRRWPVERFAGVAQALCAAGWRVVLTGTPGEAALAQALQRACPRALVNLVGRTDLWTLGALLQDARLLVCNDTGVSHIAAALGTPSVVVACGSDVRRWAPLDTARHRVLWRDLPCRPCRHAVCPTAHECATAVGTGAVLDAAFELLTCAHPGSTWPLLPSDCASSPGMYTATTSTT